MKVRGKVEKGKGEGERLGYPTANIPLKEKLASGIYRGSVMIGGDTYSAALFVNVAGTLLEAHVLDFTGDLYGKEIEVELKEKIRDVIPFESEEQMRAIIIDDILKIRSKSKSIG
ncbi:MAG: riboflavin kinase [Candidatus Taylorbacteria bacterium]